MSILNHKNWITVTQWSEKSSNYPLQVWVAHLVPKQHAGAEASPAVLAGSCRTPGQRQEAGFAVRAAGRGQETKADFHRRPGEEVAGSLLRRAAEAQRGQDSVHRREAGPQEECGEGVVLQPETEAEEDEVFGESKYELSPMQKHGCVWSHISITKKPVFVIGMIDTYV